MNPSSMLHGHASGEVVGPGSIEQIATLPVVLPVSRFVPSRKAGTFSGSPPVEASEHLRRAEHLSVARAALRAEEPLAPLRRRGLFVAHLRAVLCLLLRTALLVR